VLSVKATALFQVPFVAAGGTYVQLAIGRSLGRRWATELWKGKKVNMESRQPMLMAAPEGRNGLAVRGPFIPGKPGILGPLAGATRADQLQEIWSARIWIRQEAPHVVEQGVATEVVSFLGFGCRVAVDSHVHKFREWRVGGFD
jgi:hypothetical protein